MSPQRRREPAPTLRIDGCSHTRTEPVDVRQPGTGAVETVAQICVHCLTQLPVEWGCPDCDWDQYEEQRLCDPRPRVYTIVRVACPAHRTHQNGDRP